MRRIKMQVLRNVSSFDYKTRVFACLLTVCKSVLATYRIEKIIWILLFSNGDRSSQQNEKQIH